MIGSPYLFKYLKHINHILEYSINAFIYKTHTHIKHDLFAIYLEKLS